MPPARRTPARPGAGPGRSTRARTGTASGPGAKSGAGSAAKAPAKPTSAPGAEPTAESVAENRALAAVRRRSSLTTRAIALAVVLLVLTISYASSLRIYLSQRHDIAATRADIASRQVEIGDLQAELSRWNDPTYVKTQARERLGWVMPGEIGYRVIGADGKPVGAQPGTGAASPAPAAQARPWWSKLWGSVQAADAHPTAEAKPSKEPTITENTQPKR